MELKLPNIVVADDYHQFYEIECTITELLTSGKVTVKELGFDSDMGCYVAAIYTANEQPDESVIAELLKDNDIVLDK